MITRNDFLVWLANETPSAWWNDSARIKDLENALQNGAEGVTTNPVLIADALFTPDEDWSERLYDMQPPAQAEEIIRRVTCRVAEMFESVYEQTQGQQGYVCAQVDPRQAANRPFMLAMAKRLHTWAPNIAVKLPVTCAGLDVLEDCAAEGITITATVSFTMSQATEIGRRYQIGLERARRSGIPSGRCFAVVMVGRIDDYIRDVALDRGMDIAESDIIQCGTAIIKHAYTYFREHHYEAVLMPAGMRGSYHATALAGAEMSMSIHPKIQKMLATECKPYRQMIDIPVAPEVLERLLTIPEFIRAYQPDGMKPVDFITFGVVQKTLAQFTENFLRIESYKR